MHLLDEDLGKVWKDDQRVQCVPRKRGKLEKLFNLLVYHIFDQQGCVRFKVLPFCAISFATMMRSGQMALLADLPALVSYRGARENYTVFCLWHGFTGRSIVLCDHVAKLMAEYGKTL